MRRKTFVNFDCVMNMAMLSSCRPCATIRRSPSQRCRPAPMPTRASWRQSARKGRQSGSPPVHEVVSGDQRRLTAAYNSLKQETAAPAVLGLVKHDLFKTILDRLADNFVLWVMIPAGAPRRRVMTFSSDEPLRLHYREPSFEEDTYELRKDLRFWRPAGSRSALGLTTTRNDLRSRGRDTAASTSSSPPPGFRSRRPACSPAARAGPRAITCEAASLRWACMCSRRPTDPCRERTSGCRLYRGRLILQLSSWAVFLLLLAFATHDSVLKQTGDLRSVIRLVTELP